MSRARESKIRNNVKIMQKRDETLYEEDKTRWKSYRYLKESAEKFSLQDFGKGEAEADLILSQFLTAWGVIRVVGRERSWKNNLSKTIRRRMGDLEKFREIKLEKTALDPNMERKIKECYGDFSKALKNVAAAKVLHLLCPDFFPPWENLIIDGYRSEVYDDEPNKPEKGSPKDYFEFVKWIQGFIQNYSQLLSALSKEYRVSKVRIVDECLLCAVRYPFSNL